MLSKTSGQIAAHWSDDGRDGIKQYRSPNGSNGDRVTTTFIIIVQYSAVWNSVRSLTSGITSFENGNVPDRIRRGWSKGKKLVIWNRNAKIARECQRLYVSHVIPKCDHRNVIIENAFENVCKTNLWTVIWSADQSPGDFVNTPPEPNRSKFGVRHRLQWTRTSSWVRVEIHWTRWFIFGQLKSVRF